MGNELEQSVPYISAEDMRRTFTDIGYDQVACYVENDPDPIDCYVFSVPFTFDALYGVGHVFPDLIYSTVTTLWVDDIPAFKEEFFIRIARCFPHLKFLWVHNPKSVLQHFYHFESDDNQSHSMIEYPHLLKLGIKDVDLYLVEQFLDESRIYLPRLIELTIKYENLLSVTENFTRDLTRSACRRVKRLILDEELVPPANFSDYFPLL